MVQTDPDAANPFSLSPFFDREPEINQRWPKRHPRRVDWVHGDEAPAIPPSPSGEIQPDSQPRSDTKILQLNYGDEFRSVLKAKSLNFRVF
ncbi:unnamed protein product [Cuscuta campestris]|uniref:Uncharacterized protein n=1 Tax=Cuscuta campestris TaxID=132261 RepID=A0A484KRN0_9ASTE|nr:unnamed protein product [Cuscuta campestris]